MDEFTLLCFLQVAAAQSFTKAAAKVNRTQSAVTQQIGKLEKILGKKLFDRGREMTLTKEGEIFLCYANKIYGLHREVLDRFTHPELQGEIRFGLPEDFAAMFLSEVLADFSRTHPRILLNVECDLTLNLFERFKKREFDMVLVKMSRPEDFPNGVEVWSEGLEWIGKQDEIWDLPQKEEIPLVLSPHPCVYRKRALEALEKGKMRWKIGFTSPSYSGIIAAVNAGMGITALPKTMIPNGLEPVPKHFLPSLPDIHVSLLKERGKNECLESLEDFILKKMKEIHSLCSIPPYAQRKG